MQTNKKSSAGRQDPKSKRPNKREKGREKGKPGKNLKDLRVKCKKETSKRKQEV